MTSTLGNLDAVLECAHRIARDELSKEAEKVDNQASWPEAGLRALQAAGLAGLVVPTEFGGLGHGLLATARVCEVLARECASTALCFGMHLVASAVIAAKATPYQVEAFLDPITRGRHLTTLALSESGTGSHFYIPQTQLKETSDGQYCIQGAKSFVTNGGRADSYVVSTVAASSGTPIGEFSCVLISGREAGVHWGEPWNGLGMRGNSSRNVEFQGVCLPADNLLGRPGDQIWYVFEVVAPYFLMAMAGTYLGLLSGAFDETRSHLLKRRHSHTTSPLAKHTLLQHRLGQLWATQERTRLLIYHAAAEADRSPMDATLALFSAKAEVADCAVQVTNELMTLAGGIAYSNSSRLGRRLRDARAAHVMSPTTDMLRIWTGRALLGLPLLGDM